MNMDYLYKIKNGNYLVKIFEKNIRLRETKDNVLIPQYPEFYHFIINEYNLYGYINNADILSFEFINHILKFSEVSVYGFDILQHPQLNEFLDLLKSKKCYVKLYINQDLLNDKSINSINELYQNHLIRELHVNINKINKYLIKLLNTYSFIYNDIIINNFTFNQLNKIKDFKIVIKSINNKNDKIINDIIDNFSNVQFDNNSIINFNLNKHLHKDVYSKNIDNNKDSNKDNKDDKLINNSSILSHNSLFSIVFDLNKKVFYKSFNSNEFFTINDDLENMYKTIKNA